MPPRENALIHRNTDVVYGRGGNDSVQVTIRSFNPYIMTGVIQAAVANYLIGGRQQSAGFTSACQAVGYRELLGQMQVYMTYLTQQNLLQQALQLSQLCKVLQILMDQLYITLMK